LQQRACAQRYSDLGAGAKDCCAAGANASCPSTSCTCQWQSLNHAAMSSDSASSRGPVVTSTLLAERELATGRLVRPLQGRCEDVVYLGHWLVFPVPGDMRRQS